MVDRGNGAGPGTRREEFGASEMTTTGETSSVALAAQAEAMVKSRFVVAMKMPRDIDDVRARMLQECRRPGFAAVAIYRKPIGEGIEGLSIRFAEAALRCMRNMSIETMTIFDDSKKRITRISVTDIEANNSYFTDVTIEKTVERRRLKEGQTPVGSRINSTGQRVYLVEATEDDLLNKQNALVSKAIRTNGLRHIPGDILDECERVIYEIRAKKDAEDPDAARKTLMDGFAELRVMPSDLKEFLGHEIGSASPAEIQKLRGVYVAIRDGEATWPDCLAFELDARAKDAKADEKKGAPKDVKDRVAQKAAAKTDPKAPATEAKPAANPADWADPAAGERPDIK